MSASKVLKHPDKDEIIELLATKGESVREIESMLRSKYPSSKHLWISSVTLQKFRKENLKLEGRVLRDIQEAGRVQKQQSEKQEKIRILESTGAYTKKINEIADSKLDVQKRILQLDRIIESRMEYWYNAIISGTETASKGDKELRQFMDRQMNLLSQYKKLVEGMADRTIDHNVNITVMNEQIGIIQDVIRECISSFSPEQAMLFMEKLNRRLNATTYRPKELQPALSLVELKKSEEDIIDGEYE